MAGVLDIVNCREVAACAATESVLPSRWKRRGSAKEIGKAERIARTTTSFGSIEVRVMGTAEEG